jgi:hypothetical protein
MNNETERAAFEKAMNDARFFPREFSFAMTKSPSGRDEYANGHLESCWVGWQARAAFAAPAQTGESLNVPMTDQKIYEWAEGYQFSTKGNPHKMTFSRKGFIDAVRTIMSHASKESA